MARQTSYGDLLREARERRRMDLASVSRRLRIRPDILKAIEAADFQKMPPRGYTRNMITSYARLVGLDPVEVSSMYLDEVHAFETGRARSGVERRDTPGSRPHAEGRSARSSSQQRSSAQGTRENRRNRATRTEHVGARPSRTAPRPSRSREPQQGYVGGRSYPSLYSNNSSSPSIAGRPLLFIGLAVVVLILVIVLAFALGGKDKQQEDIPSVPISGLTDTSNPETEQQVQQVDTPPTSVKVEYKVASGAEVYAEINDNGTAESKMLTGPVTETVEVTGTWSFSAWVTDAITVTVDGEKVEYTQDGSGIPTWKVDFDSYLEKWYEAHPDAKKDSESKDASSSSSSSSSSSGSTS